MIKQVKKPHMTNKYLARTGHINHISQSKIVLFFLIYCQTDNIKDKNTFLFTQYSHLNHYYTGHMVREIPLMFKFHSNSGLSTRWTLNVRAFQRVKATNFRVRTPANNL